jgi:uncharacterized protein
VLERIVERLDPEEFWLFGSRAENRARPSSDYDLLAVLPVDLVPCTRSEFEEEKHEIDTLPRAAFLRGVRLYESCHVGSPRSSSW